MLSQKECDQLNSSKANIKELWNRACAADGIDPASKFAIFSPDNQHASEHNLEMGVYFDLLQRIRKNEAARIKRQRHRARQMFGQIVATT